MDSDASDAVSLSTEHVFSIIERYASSTAVILLPGIQYYTGQLLDIKEITATAHAHDLLIGWDLAHAVGNVVLELDDWDVDFAVWCNYKYVNSGPGAIGGMYVNSRHGKVDSSLEDRNQGYQPRLSGWWGGDKAIRFEMGKGRHMAPNVAHDFRITLIANRFCPHRRSCRLPSRQPFSASSHSCHCFVGGFCTHLDVASSCKIR